MLGACRLEPTVYHGSTCGASFCFSSRKDSSDNENGDLILYSISKWTFSDPIGPEKEHNVKKCIKQ